MIKIGDKAPLFVGSDQSGNKLSLDDFKDKKLALYFYPKDDTPGCTEQACNLRDNYSALKKAGFEIVGVSIDDEKKHKRFSEKYNLPFPLLSDTEKKIVESYGVWGEKSMFGNKYMGTARTTFIIENGIITNIIKRVKTKEHAAQLLT